MKLKVRNIILFFIFVILFIDARFMGIIPIPDMLYRHMGSSSRVLVAILSIMLALWCYLRYKSEDIFKNKFINLYILILFVSVGIVFVYTVIVYNEQPLTATIRWAIQYLIPILFYPIYCYLLKADSEENLLLILNIFVLVYNILFILQAILFNTNGIVFLTEFVKNGSLRDGFLKMSLSSFNPIMILYNFDCIFKNENKKKLSNVIFLIIGLFATVYVQRTRSIILILIGCMFLYLINLLRNKKTALISLVLITGGIIFLMNSPYISKLINSFFGEELAISTTARVYAYNHYWNAFINNPLTGFGFARNEMYYSIVHGKLGIAYIEDVGIVGQMATLGIFSFVIYIPFAYRVFYVYKNTKSKFILLLIVYVLATSVTLICLDSGRIITVPIIMAICEYKLKVYNKLQLKSDK